MASSRSIFMCYLSASTKSSMTLIPSSPIPSRNSTATPRKSSNISKKEPRNKMSSRRKFTKPESRWSLSLKGSSMTSKRKSTSQSLLTMTPWKKVMEKSKNKFPKSRPSSNASHHAWETRKFWRQSLDSMLKTRKFCWGKNWTRSRTELRSWESREWLWCATWMQPRQWSTSWAITFTCRSRTGRMR